MFWPSNHLINFTHAHLHVIHMDINGIKKNEAVVYEFSSHMHAMVMVGCAKSLGSFGGTGKENHFQTCPPADPNGPACTWFMWRHAWDDPNFLGARGHGQCGPQARCERIRTLYARCVTSGHCSRVLSPQNAYKMHRVSEMNGSCHACLLCSSYGVHNSLVSIGETEKKNLLVVHGASGGIHAIVPTIFDLIIFQVWNRKENL